MSGIEESLFHTLDSLLARAALVAWWLLTLYTVALFFRTLWRHSFEVAVIWLLSYRVMLPLLLVVSLNLVSASLVFIYPQHAAVVVSIVSPGGIRPLPLGAGLHWIVPLLEHTVSYPIYWQTYTMSNSLEEGDRFGDDSIRARTSDGQEVHIASSVIFRINVDQLVSLHIDWQDRYMDHFVRPMTRGLVRLHVSQFTVREVNSQDRKALEATLDRILRQEFADKGFALDRFLLRDITFGQDFNTSIEQKQVALEGAERTLHEADQIRHLARGQADAIKMIAEELERNPDVLTYYYIDKLSPNIRAMLVPTNTPLILPTPRMLDSEAAPGQPQLEPARAPGMSMAPPAPLATPQSTSPPEAAFRPTTHPQPAPSAPPTAAAPRSPDLSGPISRDRISREWLNRLPEFLRPAP